MKGTDLLHTEILYRIKRCNGAHMALPLSLKPRSTRGVGTLQDPRIHGTTRDPTTRRGTKLRNRSKLKKDVEEYHLAYNIDFEEGDLETFICRRPDGLAFDKDRYSSHVGFINHFSRQERSGWKAT